MSRVIKIYTPDRSEVAFRIDLSAYKARLGELTNASVFIDENGWNDTDNLAKLCKILTIHREQYYGIDLELFLKQWLPEGWRMRL
jgi:hypothetical protein